MNNLNLTAANEADVLALIDNGQLKTLWQVWAEQWGKARADRMLAGATGKAIKTVKAARFYW